MKVSNVKADQNTTLYEQASTWNPSGEITLGYHLSRTGFFNQWSFSSIPSQKNKGLRPMVSAGAKGSVGAFLVWRPVSMR